MIMVKAVRLLDFFLEPISRKLMFKSVCKISPKFKSIQLGVFFVFSKKKIFLKKAIFCKHSFLLKKAKKIKKVPSGRQGIRTLYAVPLKRINFFFIS